MNSPPTTRARWKRRLLLGLAGLGLLAVLALAGLVALVLLGHHAQPQAPTIAAFTRAETGPAGRFGGGQEVPVGSEPTSLAVADMDSDGDLDLLTTSSNDSTITIRFNNGRGEFTSGTPDLLVGKSPVELVAGDLDGDGRPDLVVVQLLRPELRILLNDGHGGFVDNGTVAVGKDPGGLVLGDVDADGDLDLLVCDYLRYGTVRVCRNDGKAKFEVSQQVAVDAFPIALALADLDADGDMDLLAANYGSTKNAVSVRLNDGKGKFSGTQSAWAGYHPHALAVADLNGDGHPDLLTSDENHTLKLRLGNGRGGFEPRRLTVLVHTDPHALALGDVDGDGDLDLLAPSMTVADTCRATAGVWRNDGHAGFGLAQDVPIGNCGSPRVVLADVDGDGRLDLLTANQSVNTVSVRLNAHEPSPGR